MKSKLKSLLATMTVVFVVFNCSQERIAKSVGQLQFSFSSNAVNSGGRVESTATPSFALLSIKDSQGNLVQSSKKLTLYSFGGSYVTESLQLSVGNFALTQFMILDSADNVLYATPMEGSVLAKYVTDPLPINFSITENGTTLVTPQVLAVTSLSKPEAFGYVSFGFEVVQANLLEFSLSSSPSMIQKVTLEFNNGVERIYKEVIPVNDELVFNADTLKGKKWSATIIVWFNSGNCYQAISRFKGVVDFILNKSVTLPALGEPAWQNYYCSEHQIGLNKISIYRSKNYKSLTIEIELSQGQQVYYGYADMGYWDANNTPVCNMSSTMVPNTTSSFIQVPFSCNAPNLTYVDNLIVLDLSGMGHVEDYFAWTIDNQVSCESTR